MAYRLYLDEVGHDDLAHAHDDAYRYLSLSGVIMDQAYARDVATPTLNEIKARIFKHDPEVPVILHRKDIMQTKGPFGILNDSTVKAAFDAALLKYLEETEFSLITVVIDKLAMMNIVHWENKHPYHYLMDILVEKYARWLIRHNSVGDIMPEERKGKKDKDLQRAYARVRIWGTSYISAAIIKARIPAKELKFRSKRDNVTGLQICDLVASPSHRYIRTLQGNKIALGAFSEQVVPMLKKSKYDRSQWGTVRGYGVKYLP
jgi:hypothetical protein